MNIIETRVPFYVDHISDWNEIFQEINFNGHIIVNKIVTGCGFTEFFLNNPIPTVLCSPRKILLEKYKTLISYIIKFQKKEGYLILQKTRTAEYFYNLRAMYIK